jgi:hypothetical protein
VGISFSNLASIILRKNINIYRQILIDPTNIVNPKGIVRTTIPSRIATCSEH